MYKRERNRVYSPYLPPFSMEEPRKTGPRDVFVHLLAIIFLYVCVVSFSALLFGYINIYFPDILHGDYGRYARAGIRWPISILFIVFPFYLWLNSYLQKDLLKYPEKRELRVRKWLLHFTLFLATIVIIGDLVTLMYQFLSGGISTRFLLKVLTVLVIAVAVFLYYGWNLRKSIPPMQDSRMKLFVQGVVALGALAIVSGFFVVGSPQAERLWQFDERRISDLNTIQWQIVNEWQTKEELPATLDELRDDISGFVPPRDPETGEPYGYRVTGNLGFELCASFKTSSKGEDGSKARSVPVPAMDPYGMQENWMHDVGEACFARTIDPERFPPVKQRLAPLD